MLSTSVSRTAQLARAIGFVAAILPGCGDDGCSTCPPPPSGVHGRVVDFCGEPVGGILVVAMGKAPVTTAPDGSFTIDNVAATYDLTVLSTVTPHVLVFKGVTRRDPRVEFGSCTGEGRTAHIRSGVPDRPGTTLAFFASNVFTGFESVTLPGPVGDVYLALRWYQPPPVIAGQLGFLHWTSDAKGLATDFDQVALVDLTVRDGDSHFVVVDSSAITDPTEATISGSVELPSGYAQTDRSCYLVLGKTRIGFSGEASPASPEFAYSVPLIPNGHFEVLVTARSGPLETRLRKTGIAAGARNLRLALRAAPHLRLPAEGALNVDASTQFTWSQEAGPGVCDVVFYPGEASQPTFTVVLDGSSTHLPDLAAEGIALPRNAHYTWKVYRYSSLASVDEALVGPSYFEDATTHRALGDQAISEEFTFTTTP